MSSTNVLPAGVSNPLAFAPPRAPSFRPLGGLERLFWSLEQSRPLHFVLAAEVAGPAAPDAWAAAVRAAQRRHPLAACSIRVRDDGTPYWQPGPDSIPLRVVRGSEGRPWEREVEAEAALPFRSDRGPLMRAVLVEGTDRAVFILSVHHAVTDGLGGAYFLRDVLRSLSGQPLGRYDLPPCQEDLLRAAPAPDEPSPEAGGPPAGPPEPATYREAAGGSPVVRRLRLSPDLTRAVRERARAEGATVHAALSAAVHFVARRDPRAWGTKPVRVFSPISVRGHAGLGEECVLALWCGVVGDDRSSGGGLWEAARRARRDLRPGTTARGAREGAAAVEAAMADLPDAPAVSAFAAQAFAFEVLLTNLGPDPIETSFGPLTVEGLWGPVVLLGYEGEQTIGVTTLHGALLLTHTSHSPVPELLAAVERELATACDRTGDRT